MKLIDEYLRCNGLVVRGTRFETNILKVLKLVKTQATLVWTLLTMNSFFYILWPIIRPGRHFTEDLFVLYGLEPMRESPNYEVASVLMVSAVFFSAATTVQITIFIIVLIGYLEAQMLALSEEMINIWDDSEKYYNVYKLYHKYVIKRRARNIFLKIRLHDIVKFQIVNTNLRNKVEHELRVFFLSDLIFIILALVTELVGGLENTWIQMPWTFVLLFIDCYIGQRLIDAGAAYENSIYNCKWENFDVDNQKTVLFMLQCSQKPLSLSAGGISVLNFPSLMSMLRSTYSAYTTLKSTAQT
ncbi:olfactory receptor receptor [Danaus plexippus plexippus]|uniref:Olfactory receptor receptor n=1 Tax=Danaus plexippus plexippus TaxID=278856 RepID=A0A212ERN2_DANPL|nr:olfactory receptor receptor [Danaus plexippus plexippus]